MSVAIWFQLCLLIAEIKEVIMDKHSLFKYWFTDMQVLLSDQVGRLFIFVWGRDLVGVQKYPLQSL